MNTSDQTPQSLVSPSLLTVEIVVEDRPGETLVATDWMGADGELREIATVAGGSYTKVGLKVQWRDGFVASSRYDVHRGDELIAENLLVRHLRREGLCFTGQLLPLGETAASWDEKLRTTFRDFYPALVEKWRTVLAHLPVQAGHAFVPESLPVEQEDPWGGETHGSSSLPAAAPANDAATPPGRPGRAAEYTPPPVFEGAKYVAGRDKAETAKLMRAELKALGATGTPAIPKGTTFSVRVDRYSMGASIDVYVTPPPGFVTLNVARVMVDLGIEKEGASLPPRLTEQANALLDVVREVRMSYNRDASDRMADYYNVHFGGDVRFDTDFEDAQRAVIEHTLRAVFPNAKRWPQ